MSFKLNRYHRDYLFWIYPFIFIGLTFYAVIEDRHDKESTAMANSKVKADSSISKSAQTSKVDSLRFTYRVQQSELLMGN
jgi:hypothetical protein